MTTTSVCDKRSGQNIVGGVGEWKSGGKSGRGRKVAHYIDRAQHLPREESLTRMSTTELVLLWLPPPRIGLLIMEASYSIAFSFESRKLDSWRFNKRMEAEGKGISTGEVKNIEFVTSLKNYTVTDAVT